MKPSLHQAQTCLDRYKEWVSSQLLRTRWFDDPTMSDAYDARNKWFAARQVYLEEAATKAAERRA